MNRKLIDYGMEYIYRLVEFQVETYKHKTYINVYSFDMFTFCFFFHIANQIDKTIMINMHYTLYNHDILRAGNALMVYVCYQYMVFNIICLI